MKKIVINHESKTIEMDALDDLSIDILDNGNLTLKILSSEVQNNLKITANLGKDAKLQVFLQILRNRIFALIRK